MDSWKVLLITLFISILSTSSTGKSLQPGVSKISESTSEQQVGLISAKKCKEYSEIGKDDNNECTNFNPDKPWDYAAKPGEFPHIVMLYGSEDGNQSLCTGSLISEKFILTLANCSQGILGRYSSIWALIGENDLLAKTNSSSTRVKIVETYIHPNYSGSFSANDISLLKLEKDVKFDKLKKPACLNTEKEITEPVFLAGWGQQSSVGSRQRPSTLLKTVLEPTNDQTEKLLQTSNQNSPIFIMRKAQPGKRDACVDPGAPLMTNLKDPSCMYNIVGLTRLGSLVHSKYVTQCGIYTTAYRRVSTYIPWIESIVWPEEEVQHID